MIGREKKSKEIQAENFLLSITEGKRDPTRPKNQIPNESILSRHGIGTGAGAGPHPSARADRGHSRRLQHDQCSHRPGAKMKSRACRSAAATLGCHRSTMKTTRGPSSAEPGGGRRERRGSNRPEPGPGQSQTHAVSFRAGTPADPGTDRKLSFSQISNVIRRPQKAVSRMHASKRAEGGKGENVVGGTRRIFRAGRLLRAILSWWTRDITRLSRPTECTTARVNLHVNYGPELLMCQNWRGHCNQRAPLLQGAKRWEIYGGHGREHTLYFLLSFSGNQKLL